MFDLETRMFFAHRAADAREFVAIHKTSLIELGLILGVNALVAGGVFLAIQGAPAEATTCEPVEARAISGALDMPRTEPEREWQWPISETQDTAQEQPEQVEDEPVRRVHRHRRRG
jgi:hypothetical protein